jgi:ATP-dependent RNA helicase DDX51/DBP6
MPVDLQDQQMPIEDMPGLDEGLQTQLKSNGVKYFFPVQRLVIPWLLKSERFKFYRPNDVCVSAPTGSGKTLGTILKL